ncbi:MULTISPECIES: peptide chain release factor N(5)-glutamine methyltransferase [unclassified Duganella]|uniref:peptide chain release factor N(5)-glutamine methyltransferase n=1 Tax=unclassified Duganella TaxID=2636909 RepID=UPI000E34791E|nr:MULTISPECIES: peptide chain release factor N(5)-glutamine methyltransferase [unclassified Duganella]RFP12727.1 peptide chain release factor N(5)-glutamine methyltransferase [Duganella sp. BJB475]RFP28703.1 peptide chain release factor N(5)-glutamine methyltransferase [Duganella sp. BJB476]
MISDISTIAAGITIGALQVQSLLDPLDNRVLLCHALGLSRVSLITQSERQLDAEQAARFAALVQRRVAGEPVAYIVGQREFFGLPFEVNGAVLIPRPDTELLVELTLDRLPPQGRVLDMGTGSGAIAVALAHTRRDAAVTALDVSPDALAVARRNAAANSAQVNFLQSDWYAALQGQPPFDVIASNPPYIASGDRHLSEGDLRYEPTGALTDHADGLSALRIIVAGAAAHLKPQGWLLMEHGYDQAAAVRDLLTAQGYSEVQSWTDLAGIERVTGARTH